MTSRWDWQENALPTCQQVATALLHLLWRSPQPLTPREAYRELATQFALNRGHLNMRMRSQNELAWENRVRFARRHLVDLGFIDPRRHGVWIITESGRQAASEGWQRGLQSIDEL